MRLPTSQIRTVLLLSAVFCLYASLQVGWLTVDDRAIVEERDFIRVAHWGHVLCRDALSGVYPSGGGYVRHSPLLTLWTAPLLALFGCRADVAVLSLLPFAALLVLAVYQIALRYLSRATSAVAAVLVLSFHHFAVVEPFYPAYSFIKEYKADLPLSALVAATCWAMLVLHERASRRAIGLAVLTMVVGMLTRISYPLYVAILAAALWVEGRRDGRSWVRIAVALGIAFCAVSPWYLFHAAGIVRYFTERELNPSWALHTGMPEFMSTANLLFYARGLRNILSWPFLIVASLGLLLLLVRRARGIGFIVSGLLITYWILFLLPGKSIRFLAPCLFFVALVVAAPLDALRGAFCRHVAVTLMVTAACIRMLCMNGVVPGYDDISGISNAELRPVKDDWCVGRIFKDAVSAHQRGAVLRIAVVPFLGHFRHGSFEQEALEQGIRLRDESTWLIRGDAWREELKQADFLVTKSGANGPPLYAPHREDIDSWLKTESGAAFGVVGRYALPDGSEAVLRQQRIPPASEWRIHASGMSTNVVARFGDAIVLRSVQSWREGDRVRIQCEWEATARPRRDYRFFVQLRKGRRNAETAGFVPARGAHPTGTWRPGLHLIETYEVLLPHDTGQEDYTVWCGLHRGARRLPISEYQGDVFRRAMRIGSTLLLPKEEPSCECL